MTGILSLNREFKHDCSFSGLTMAKNISSIFVNFSEHASGKRLLIFFKITIVRFGINILYNNYYFRRKTGLFDIIKIKFFYMKLEALFGGHYKLICGIFRYTEKT